MKISRRSLLFSTGLISGAALVGIVVTKPSNHRIANNNLAGVGEGFATSWIKIRSDNVITIFVPHAEMGQGVLTALGMMAADELDADWTKVRVESAPAQPMFTTGDRFNSRDGQLESIVKDLLGSMGVDRFQSVETQLTAASSSIRYTGELMMRGAGAAARELLLKCAANAWNVPVTECRTNKSSVIHEPTTRTVSYGSLVDRVAEIEPSSYPTLKAPDKFQLMGTNIPRVDIPAKVDGSASYGIDIQLDSLIYAAVRFAPIFGARVISVTAERARKSSGVIDILTFENCVAVVANNYWRAERALNLVEIQFSATANDTISTEDIYSAHSSALDSGPINLILEQSDSDFSSELSESTFQADYSVPYLAHAAMEPMNCTVHFTPRAVEVWAGVQDPLQTRIQVSAFADVSPDRVNIHQCLLGGSFGRRLPAHSNVLETATRLAKYFSVPVKTILSREEDIRQDYYRPASYSRFRADLSQNGRIVSWVNSFTGPLGQTDAVNIPYKVGQKRIEQIPIGSHVPQGNWRSVDHSQHTFFTESFIDELAHYSGISPLQYRLQLLTEQPRLKNTLETAANLANLGTANSVNRTLGFAVHECFGSVVAHVVEVVMATSDTFRILKVFCAIDCGRVINPDIVLAQVESAILFGINAAVFEEIEIGDGQVVQGNFNDYRMLRLSQVPEIEIEIIDSKGLPGGVGETATPAIAPALTNAIFQATGIRIRRLPISNYSKLTLV